MAGKGGPWPYGSTAPLREDVLRVLGVLKVATADQIQELTRPHLTFRHPAPRNRGHRTAAHRNAALDLAHHGLVLSEGRSRDRTKLYGLTAGGLEAASRVLGRPMTEMGSIAHGAAVHGAAHMLDVNESVLVLLRPAPSKDAYDRLEPADQAVVDTRPRGIGALDTLTTEVDLPVTGTDARPGIGSVQADLVITVPEHRIPLMFVCVDRSTMVPERVVLKLRRYQQYFERKDRQGEQRWRNRWCVYEDQLPNVALVLTGRSDAALSNRARTILSLADGLDTLFPVICTTLPRLQEHGPWGETWWSTTSRDQPQPLDRVLGLTTGTEL
ncbi:replication-relaxation family protein [Streptomyces sp. NPDC050145]|uniref:replication-relaxation family protein n=1 Tax=Streptomyces sp. NPDC050145 TaxID=3365602 RepID=UPI00378DD8FE